MPELDYMVLADYVRQDGGVIHIMGAGVDTVSAPVVPTVQPFDVAYGTGSRTLKVVLTADEQVIVSVMVPGED